MKNLPLRFVFVSCLAAVSFSTRPVAAAAEASGTSLFDGTTLNGWRGYKTPARAEAWKVIDGAIVLKAKVAISSP